MLDDPFNEFFIRENRLCKKENIELDLNDRYWEERFTFRVEMVPSFLDKHMHMVLHAGKYLFVIRECGRLDVKNPIEDTVGQLSFSSLVTGKKQKSADVDMMQIDTETKPSQQQI